MSNAINSYPSIYSVSHRAAAELLLGPVSVEEKVDGSQFSFGVLGGELFVRSKGAKIHVEDPPALFKSAVATAERLAPDLIPEMIYRGEVLAKPKHNVLAYDRVPAGNIILFDIVAWEEKYMTYDEKKAEAERLGLEVVPLLHSGRVDGEMLLNITREYIPNIVSVLGGCTIEGVVIKNYEHYGPDHKILIGKIVSEKFKEVHQGEWKAQNPGKADVMETLVKMYRTDARWEKAIIHLAEREELTNSPADIGPLLKEINIDVFKEETETIKQFLFDHYKKEFTRLLTRGFPEWYKQKLVEETTVEIAGKMWDNFMEVDPLDAVKDRIREHAADPEVRESAMQGIADLEAGRTTPLNEVLEEMGLTDEGERIMGVESE